jgi:hypothetical protein
VTKTDYDIRSEALKRAVEYSRGNKHGLVGEKTLVLVAKEFEKYLKGPEL